MFVLRRGVRASREQRTCALNHCHWRFVIAADHNVNRAGRKPDVDHLAGFIANLRSAGYIVAKRDAVREAIARVIPFAAAPQHDRCGYAYAHADTVLFNLARTANADRDGADDTADRPVAGKDAIRVAFTRAIHDAVNRHPDPGRIGGWRGFTEAVIEQAIAELFTSAVPAIEPVVDALTRAEHLESLLRNLTGSVHDDSQTNCDLAELRAEAIAELADKVISSANALVAAIGSHAVAVAAQRYRDRIAEPDRRRND